jgi:hypothetical protein
MVSKEVVNYIKKELMRGVHIQKIKRALISVGHSASSVEEAIKQAIRKPNAKRNPAIFPIAVLVILIIFLSVVGGVLWVNKSKMEVSVTEIIKEEEDGAFNVQAFFEDNMANCLKEGSEPLCTALSTNNVSACDKNIEEFRRDCRDHFFLATTIKSKDKLMCGSIEDNYLKKVCEVSLSGDYSICGTDEVCSSLAKEDISICTNQDCEIKFYYIKAIKEGDISICDYIEDDYNKQTCKGALGEDISICTDRIRCLEKVYNLIAKKTDDPSYCDRITEDESARERCKIGV